MNKSNIEWCDYTTNPIVGCTNSLKVCPVRNECYAEKMAHRMYNMNPELFPYYNDFRTPRFYPERLKQFATVKKGSKIFVGSMADMWSDGVDIKWQFETIKAINDNFNRDYIIQFLTKNIKGYLKYYRQYNDINWGIYRWYLRKNCWLGFSDLGQINISDVEQLRETFPDNILFVSIEPFIGWRPEIVDLVDWVIVGGWSGKGLPLSKCDDLDNLISYCVQKNKPIYMKYNIQAEILKKIQLRFHIQEYPL